MHESVAVTAPGTVLTVTRLSGAVDALSSAIAGFAPTTTRVRIVLARWSSSVWE